MDKELIVVRGGGDIATGVVQKLYRGGFKVLVLEVPQPTSIRRTVCLSEAVYEGHTQVEDVPCRLVQNDEEMRFCHQDGVVPLMIDPECESIRRLSPFCVIDAIIAKRNTGTHRDMAPVTIALGPGFEAGLDVDAVIETMRGHNLGRLYLYGSALPNTGIPGEIGGEAEKRVLHAPASGVVRHVKHIGDVVHVEEPILVVGQRFCPTLISGRLRGLIRGGLYVEEGMKVADIDPRVDSDWLTISDKARCIGGSALEAFLMLSRALRQAP